MKTLYFFILLISSSAFADGYVSAGHGFNSNSYNVAAGWLPVEIGNTQIGAEVEFTDMGNRAESYIEIKRTVSLNAVARSKFSDSLYGVFRVGVNDAKYNLNLPIAYDAKSLRGWNASVGLETPITKNLFLQGQMTIYEYQLIDQLPMLGASYQSIGLRYKF